MKKTIILIIKVINTKNYYIHLRSFIPLFWREKNSGLLVGIFNMNG